MINRNKEKGKIQEKPNAKRIDANIYLEDFVMIKDRRMFIGQTKNCSQFFESVPYRVIDKTPNGFYVENLVFKNVVLRHQDELKLIKIKSENDFHLNLPNEVAEKLFQLTSDDILSNFSFHKQTNNLEKRITRSMPEKNELMESYSEHEDLSKIYDDIEKNQVTFLT